MWVLNWYLTCCSEFGLMWLKDTARGQTASLLRFINHTQIRVYPVELWTSDQPVAQAATYTTHNTTQHNTPDNNTQHNTQHNKHNTTQPTTQHNKHNTTHNTIQHTTQYNTTQHTTQHNTTQHNTKHTTHPTDKHQCPHRDSNPQSEQPTGRRPTPWTARPPGSARTKLVVCDWLKWGNLRQREHLGDPGVDGRIMLRWIFRKWDVGVWTLSSWLRIGTVGGHLWMR